MRFITDYQKFKQKMVRKPYPLPIIYDTMKQLEGFQYTTALDLNLVYYTIYICLKVATLQISLLNLVNSGTIGSQWDCDLPLAYFKLNQKSSLVISRGSGIILTI